MALGLLMAATAARAESVTLLSGDVVLRAELHRPAAGVPPAAPVVALHGCGGPFSSRDAQWARVLTAAGHTVLFPDSFGSRGMGSQCRLRQRMRGLDAARRRDALAAATWLAAQPGVPAGGVVLLGWSNGGGTVLRAGAVAPDLPPGLLRGLVAFYPACRARVAQAAWRPAAPLMLLIGEADDWTPAAPCKALVERVPMALHLYPGAYHDFDAPGGVRVRQGIAFSQNADGSVHAGGDPAARADALERVPAFLASLPPAKLSP
jgi:dienelactone hydrolase